VRSCRGAKGDREVHLRDEFPGRGRAISDGLQRDRVCLGGRSPAGGGQASLFTAAIVEGLETGEADLDRDGVVSVDDLYSTRNQRVRQARPGQTPLLSAVDVEPDLYIARNPHPEGLRLTALPAEVRWRSSAVLASGTAAPVAAPPPVEPPPLPAVQRAPQVGAPLRASVPPRGGVGAGSMACVRCWRARAWPSDAPERALAIGAIGVGAASGLYWLAFALVTPASQRTPRGSSPPFRRRRRRHRGRRAGVLLRPGASALGLLAVGLVMRGLLEQATSLVLGYQEPNLLNMLITNPGAMHVGALIPLTPPACVVAGLLAGAVWLGPRLRSVGPSPAEESALARWLRTPCERTAAARPRAAGTDGWRDRPRAERRSSAAWPSRPWTNPRSRPSRPWPSAPPALGASLAVMLRPAAGALAPARGRAGPVGIIEWVASTTYLLHESYLLLSLLTRPGDMGLAALVPLTPIALLVASALAATAWLSCLRTAGRPPAGRLQPALAIGATVMGAAPGLYWLVFAFAVPGPEGGLAAVRRRGWRAGVTASLAVLLKPGAGAVGLLAAALVMRGFMEEAMRLALGYRASTCSRCW